MLPVPLAGQVPPPAPTQVQVTPVIDAGKVSATVEPGASLGPTFDCHDGVSHRIARSDRSHTVGFGDSQGWLAESACRYPLRCCCRSRVSHSPPVATLAVLLKVPVAEAEIAAVTVYVTEPPAGRLTVSLILPEPANVQVPPPAPTQVQVAPVIELLGKCRRQSNPARCSAQRLKPRWCKSPIRPGTAEATPSVLVIPKLACGVSVSVSVALLLPGFESVDAAADRCGVRPTCQLPKLKCWPSPCK
jgi:hypothetical protein